MFTSDRAFSGFSVDDLATARHFYEEVLGLDVEENAMGFLELNLTSGARVLAYVKGADHTPATFTVLNFEVDDIESAVDDLNARGVVTTIYDPQQIHSDAKGIVRGRGPDIAWFTDPAGNVMSVLSSR